MIKQTAKGRDYIVFGLQPWDFEMGSNCKNVAIELARDNRVLYVNRPVERSSLWKYRNDPKIKNRMRSIRTGEGVLEDVQENIRVFNPRVILESIHPLPHGMIYNYISRLNARRFAREIHWAIKQSGFTDPVLFIDNDMLKGYYLIDYLKPAFTIYYIRDFLLSQAYFVKHGSKMEPAIMKKADLVVANSAYLANYAAQYNPESYDIGQGCELESYIIDGLKEPADLTQIGHPRIGYVGALLDTRLDIALLEDVARSKPDWQIVLVGPEDPVFAASGLHRLPNVHFLGSKPVAELPAYVHHFDVCINPQRINQMTIGNYPRKIDEYLAAGKPVVATTTEAMQLFSAYSLLGKSAEDYVELIGRALQEEKPEMAKERRNFALSHSWEASVSAMYQAMEKVTGKTTTNA